MRFIRRAAMISLLVVALILINMGVTSAAEVEQISLTYPMQKVVLRGSHYKIGFDLGTLAKNAGVKTKKMTDAERDRLLEYKEFYEQVYPPFVDELRGIWAAFGLNYDDMEFNVEEIPVNGQKVGWRIRSDMLAPMCSGFSLTATATKDGEVLFARNFDWFRMPCSIVFMYPEGAYPSVGCTPYDVGLSIVDGMNSEGLKLSLHTVVNSGVPQPSPGLPQGMAARVILDTCRTVDEAVDFLKNTPISFPIAVVHILVGDRSGGSAIVEFVGRDVIVVRPEDDYQVMTNSYHSQDAHLSCWRYQTADRMIKENHGFIDDDVAKEILRAVRQGNTQWSVIYKSDVNDVLIALADRPSEFYEFSFLDTTTPVETIGKLSTTWGSIKVDHVVIR